MLKGLLSKLRTFVPGIYFFPLIFSHPYDPRFINYNINTNQTAGNNILDYNSDWPEKNPNGQPTLYTPSPANWRELPTYTILVDKGADGDPSNNDFFNTKYEWHLMSNQLRHGGDIIGFSEDRVLDYIYGMGYRTIYFAGTPWVNLPWQSDGYSALDFTLLDPHFGTLSDWRKAIDKIHSKGLYVMLDTTTSTLADLLGFSQYLKSTAPFNIEGYTVEYKKNSKAPWGLDHYADFNYSNTRDPNCQLPKYYNVNGSEVIPDEKPTGCFKGDFDQFGDSDMTGARTPWKDQLTKYSSVQDRLREWDSTIAAKLLKLACLSIQALDIDALRVDKATQQSVDFVGKWGGGLRTCAKALGKNNFFITGEISGANTYGTIYVGRGRQPIHYAGLNVTSASLVTPNDTDRFMRPVGENGLDSAAFHYSIYRALTRFLGLDGTIEAPFDVPSNFKDAWEGILISNDFLNQETGLFDSRHMYGTTNQDVFRWPALINGTEKLLLGQIITNLVVPGIPLLFYGEEQAMYLFDSQSNDYLFGRQPMTSNSAWQRHGCYVLGSKRFLNLPLGKALTGCHDDWNSLDHFDPTSEVRNILAHFTYLRAQYSSLRDGMNLTQLGNWTSVGQLPGSKSILTEWGLWSVSRSALSTQVLNGPKSNTPVWILFTNLNETKEFMFDCQSPQAILSPYPSSSTLRNLLYPYETFNLESSVASSAGSGFQTQGCLRSLTLEPFSYKILVPTNEWVPPLPRLVGSVPSHDTRILSKPRQDKQDIPISLIFSEEMSCSAVSSALSLSYTIEPHSNITPRISLDNVTCSTIPPIAASVAPAPAGVWKWSSHIVGAVDGVYELMIANASSLSGSRTDSLDHLLFRKGGSDNPITFRTANQSRTLLQRETDGHYKIVSNAAGAELMRYTADFGKSHSSWTPYQPEFHLPKEVYSQRDFWQGNHIQVQYWSRLTGSAAHTVDADSEFSGAGVRRFPQLLLRGSFNQWGYDKGIPNLFTSRGNNLTIDVVTSWPNEFQVTVFDTLDKLFYGDVDKDGTLDLLPPSSQASNYLSLPPPRAPFLGWRIAIDPVNLTWGMRPIGHQKIVLILFVLLAIIPPGTAFLACWLFRRVFYGVKFNQYGTTKTRSEAWKIFSPSYLKNLKRGPESDREKGVVPAFLHPQRLHSPAPAEKRWPEDITARRKVLIATLEYEIIDWKLKVKIGGLGVMSSLMGKVMEDVDLIWVIPKISGMDYPTADLVPPIPVRVLGETYFVECQIHKFENITYFLLDSPVFRANTKSNPYPARMDDLSSAIFYSFWNQCIAEVCRRTPDLDIYHINDYHGALAPLYLLPLVLPVCLSLHNAEFQGLWPLGTEAEESEVCHAFNISKTTCNKYVRFGNVFNLLHAAASFISQHQNSVGVAGVSEKYGKRSWARYPALWTLKSISPLSNPDPTDIEALEETPFDIKEVKIDHQAEFLRPGYKRQLQEWAGLDQNDKAQLFVFVGRWSFQKGVDLIADVFTSLLDRKPEIQLISIGPVIDLYGRFAAIKLERLMRMYPRRVFSKPEFTSLPAFVFSGSDFALIPSRDEPFGLVAVEFGRKGALGIGSRLGGLGLMPGWWFPVESDSTSHMQSQFSKAIEAALSSSEEHRAILRARSVHQRFPVIEWREKMQRMHYRSIQASKKHAAADTAWHLGKNSRVGSEAYETPPGVSGCLTPSDDTSKLSELVPPQENTIRAHSAISSRFQKPIGFLRNIFVLKSGPAITPPAGIPTPPSLPGSSIIAHNPQELLSSISQVEAENPRDGAHLSLEFKREPNKPNDPNSPLNQIAKDFTDESGAVSEDFTKKLEWLTPQNSEKELCIADYLVTAEKAYFKHVREGTLALARQKFEDVSFADKIVKIGIPLRYRSPTPSRTGSFSFQSRPGDKTPDIIPDVNTALDMNLWQVKLQRTIYGWPLYTILLALGQILSGTSFQLSLLSGTSSRTSFDLYVIGAINILGSICWYGLSSRRPAVWSLSIPWALFGFAFMLVGLPSISETLKVYSVRHALSLVASSLYSLASAAGFLFFSLNFGEEAGGNTSSWVFRACIIQGTQQIWVAALWYWGFKLQNVDPVNTAFAPSPWINAITLGLSLTCFIIGYALFMGLPKYYRQNPGAVPNFIRALFRRKLVLWYLATEVLRNYWLSGPYGRNWTFLWTTSNIPPWATVCFLIIFFVVVWGGLVWLLGKAAKDHTWIVAIFAVGLGAPRWCQMLWGTSSVASYIAWAGGAGSYLALSLWLWLGVLDAVQGVGLGMILLQTLSRVHVAATLCLAQIIGSTAVLVARATAPNRIGPGAVFPDLGLWDPSLPILQSPLASWQFWIALISQLIIVAGYFVLFRREQLSKP